MQSQVIKNDPFIDAAAVAPALPYVPAEDRRERYFFYAGDEPGRAYPGGLSVGTLCIPNKLIRRCQVTPCISVYSPPKRTVEIPDGRIILGTQDADFPGMAREWIYAGPEATTLLYEYGGLSGLQPNWGLVELLPNLLTGMPREQVRALAITDTIFPAWPDIPETNAEVMMHLREVELAIESNKHLEFKWSSNDIRSVERRDIYLACIEQMKAAVEAAQDYQAAMINAANIAVTLPSTEPGYKKKFDERDILFSKRTSIPLAVNSLRQNASNSLETLVAQLSEKLQPVQAPQDNTAATVAAVLAALKDQGFLTIPGAEDDKPKPQNKK